MTGMPCLRQSQPSRSARRCALSLEITPEHRGRGFVIVEDDFRHPFDALHEFTLADLMVPCKESSRIASTETSPPAR